MQRANLGQISSRRTQRPKRLQSGFISVSVCIALQMLRPGAAVLFGRGDSERSRAKSPCATLSRGREIPRHAKRATPTQLNGYHSSGYCDPLGRRAQQNWTPMAKRLRLIVTLVPSCCPFQPSASRRSMPEGWNWDYLS